MSEIGLAAYVALGYWTPSGVTLDARLELLVGRLSAELSACHWCIADSGHRCLKAFLPADLVSHIQRYETTPAFTDRERSALGLVEAVARHTEGEHTTPDEALARARRYFTEPEVRRLASVAAGEHFFNPATGALGLDAARSSSPGTAMPWHAIDKGLAIRGLY